MVTIDIKSVQQILQKKFSFGHTKRHSKKTKQNRLSKHKMKIYINFFKRINFQNKLNT